MATADKYDRQLRLWGAGGQRKLMNSHILLVNADAVGTETLKNLVLPGVGKFTILDNKVISSQDASVNFFQPEKDIGKFRADVSRDALCEMNPDVVGFSLVSTLESELEKDPSFIEKFSVVILTNPTLADSHLISTMCWDSFVPLVVVKSYGFIGECRLQLRDHDMIETKPDPEHLYLRTNAPFESLQVFCDSIDFSNQTPEEFAHAPYMAILRHQAKIWASNHDGKSPTGRLEMKEFKEILKTVGTPVEYCADGTKKQSYLRDNYKEAQLSAAQFFEPVALPPVLEALFAMESLMTISGPSKINDFKILLISLKKYIETVGEGVHWPLSGVVPDLTTTSDMYMALQQLYQRKAECDRLAFKEIVKQQLVQCNRAFDSISDETIQIFCRNIMNLRFLSSECSIRDRDLSPRVGFARSFLNEEIYWDDPIQTPLLYHYLLMAADRFRHVEGRYPGSFSESNSDRSNNNTAALLAADTESVWKILCQIAHEHDVPCKSSGCMEEDGADEGGDSSQCLLTHEHAQEITRYGGAELHNISSLLGGVAAQECVKVMTHLFVPMHNCYLYNGIAGCSSTFEV